MLAGLARMLRAAGHDTALAEAGQPDSILLDICRQQDRALVSRDRRLVAVAQCTTRVVLLVTDDLDGQARALAAELGLDWLHAPFTRCLIDNTPLSPADPEQVKRVPERSQALPGPFRSCPCCGRLYWPGSHARRMTERLRRWQGPG
jgi:uncharacterized protein with PIN domain